MVFYPQLCVFYYKSLKKKKKEETILLSYKKAIFSKNNVKIVFTDSKQEIHRIITNNSRTKSQIFVTKLSIFSSSLNGTREISE